MKQVIEEKKIIKTSYVTVEPTKKFLSFRHYFKLKKKKKIKKIKKKNKSELRIKNIHSFTLTSVSVFSILSFIYTLWH